MNRIQIQFDGGRTRWDPGSRLGGVVTWELAQGGRPRAIELRLIWVTTGGCAQQVGRVETIEFLAPAEADSQPFAFVLPDRPWSFEGRLARLRWAVEAVLVPGGGAVVAEFTLGPGGQAVRLASGDPGAPVRLPPVLSKPA